LKNVNEIKNDINLTFTNSELHHIINNKILNKDVITLSPAGIYGYYDIGTCMSLLKNFDLKNKIFCGASAGSWNSLFLSYKKKHKIDNFMDTILKNTADIPTYSFKTLQQKIKDTITSNYDSDDFDLHKIYISVAVLENFHLTNYIYTDFNNLEEVLDCCIASSNIPFITGDLILKYKNKITYDGGYFDNRYLPIKKHLFNINSSMWGKKRSVINFLNINNDIRKLYYEGLEDSTKGIPILKEILENK